MMLKKITLASFAIVLLSCGRDSDNVETNTAPILPTKIIETENGNVDYSTFRYNGDKITDFTQSNGRKREFIYNGDDIVKETIYSNKGELEEVNEYFYNNGRLISQNVSIIDKYYPIPFTYTINYKYVTDNYVQFTKTTGYSNGSSGITYFYSLYDVYLTNGNLTKVITTQKEGSVTGPAKSVITYTYDYDNKNNPFKNIKGFLKIKIFASDPGFLVSSNNMVKYTMSQSNNFSSFTDTLTANIAYTYNNNSFPTKSVTVPTSTSLPSSSYTTVVEYNR